MRKIATTLLTLAASLSMVMGGTVAANASPVLIEVMLDYGYDGTVRGGILDFNENIPPTTQVYVTVSACGRVLHTETFDRLVPFTDSTTGETEYIQAFRKDITKSMSARAIEVSVSFSDPSLPPTSYTTYTHNGYPASCDALEPEDDNSNGGSGITVSKWSVKKGATTTAKVGKTLKVTPTRAAGAKVTYVWKVGTKVADRDRAMLVKKTYRGKKVTMRVTVSKAGATSVSRVLRYGKAR